MGSETIQTSLKNLKIILWQVCGSPNPRVPRNFVKEVTKLSKSARKGLKINNALKVSRDFTFLGDGGTGFVIEGASQYSAND